MNDATHPRVWLGVSVEDQKTADERIRELLRIPASIRFVSYEPALGAADFNRHAFFGNPQHQRWIDWVIAGAETGPGRRRAELDWFRAVRDQCDAAGVPFFFKRDSDGNRELDGETHEAMP
jgi:protein gp37